MIVVTGSITAKAEHAAEVEALALEHVRRSRTEPGCLLHSVHRDVEEPLRFVFVEHWTDRDALLTHFGVPASGEMVARAAALSSTPPTIEIYEAEKLDLL